MRRNLVQITILDQIMLQEVVVDVEIKRDLWVKARPDCEPLFSILDGLRQVEARVVILTSLYIW